MEQGALRRVAAVALIAAALGALPAAAAERPGPRARAGALSEAGFWLGRLLAGWAPTAQGGRLMAAWGHEGHTIDPDGYRLLAPGVPDPGAGATTTEEGHTIDPDG